MQNLFKDKCNVLRPTVSQTIYGEVENTYSVVGTYKCRLDFRPKDFAKKDGTYMEKKSKYILFLNQSDDIQPLDRVSVGQTVFEVEFIAVFDGYADPHHKEVYLKKVENV